MDAYRRAGACCERDADDMSIRDQSHARRNLLTGEWMLVSPHRMQRPWQGQIESPDAGDEPAYDESCYLCPGNVRANDNANPDYSGPFVFDNDFPALSKVSDVVRDENPLFEARPERGRCRVVCYTEKHNLRLATMPVNDIATALGAMHTEFDSLDTSPDIGYVQIFENRGQMMGCSNQHPHAQIWATENLPEEPKKELARQSAWFEQRGTPLLSDYRDAEVADGSRIVFTNEHFVVLVPWWATWPFETLLLPRRNVAAPGALTDEETIGLASALKIVLSACDKMFSTSAPYSMGFHPRPSDGKPHPEWIYHAHIYPPLLRSATVRKHMVGFEMLGMPQRDLTPEAAAERLKGFCT